MQYRQDIQIIRGLAVLVVVLFHLGAPGFDHGFLGVDAFFVISGFLMALLFKEGETAGFLRRRAGRLLPAYFVTVLLTLAVSALVTLPSEHRQVATQAVYAGGFLSNLGFWMQASYFSKAEFTPLLHLWSLGVEIQFYLLVPLLVWLQNRFRFTWPILLAGSLAACLIVVAISPKTAFFMTPFRLWEFLLGACVARYLTVNGAPIHARPLFGAISLAALVAAMGLPIDGRALSAVSGHPGLGALVVCLATAGVVAFGLPGLGRGGRALEWLGNRSYSIYLAHFPVIALVLYQPFSGTILSPQGIGQMTLVVALIAACSLVLFHLVERRPGWFGTAGGAAALAGVVLVAAPTSAMAQTLRFTASQLNVFAALTDRSPYRCGKIFRFTNPGASVCELTGLPDSAPALLLVGDSHADSIKQSFARVAAAQGYRVFFTVSNTPLIVGSPETLLRESGAVAVFVHFSRQLIPARHLTGLLAATDVPVTILMPVPAYRTSIPKMVWSGQAGRQSLADVRALDADLLAFAGENDLAVHELAPALCAPLCRITDDEGRPLYFDANHLTLTGARRLEADFAEAITQLDAGQP